MPISGDQQLDPNKPRYGLPLDSCVGDDGPTPDQAANISGPAKIPYQGADSAPVGYNGPSPS